MVRRTLVDIVVAPDVMEKLRRGVPHAVEAAKLHGSFSLLENRFMKYGTYLFRYSDGTQEYFDPDAKQDARADAGEGEK